MDDQTLLREFVADRNGPAFAQLVRRHMDMVYSSARRQVRDSQTAEDVAQRVFVLLAQKARTIRSREVLAGWLLTATRFMAVDVLRQQARRRRHESEAAAMKNEAHTPAEAVWDAIQPMLDEFVAQLKPADRDAVALRFFQRLSLADVATALGVTPAAAQKRVQRALDKLRLIFTRRGVSTSDEALSLALAANVCSPAPKALAGSVANSVLTSPAIPLAKGVFQIMATVNSKLTIGVAATVLLAAPILYVAVQPAGAGRSNSASAQVQAKPDAWEGAFHKVYGLSADEIVKHVEPAFIPERDDFWRSQLGSTYVATAASRPAHPPPPPQIPSPAGMVIFDDGLHMRPQSNKMQGEYSAAELLKEIASVWPQETDVPRAQLIKEFPGDWIFRFNATTEKKLDALAPMLFGRGAKLTRQDVTREVIVVSGRFQPKAWPRTNNVQRMYRDQIPVMFTYRNSDKVEPQVFQIVQNQRELFSQIGGMLLRPLLIEAELGKDQPLAVLSLAEAANFIKAPDAEDPATVDGLLKILSEQTSLTFTRQQRSVSTWTLAK